ncbi:MAG: GNAT family N-acetyltransferase [Solirubrobacteraceae bacterium]|nr:GNAT family N-acetyltransferase [Solirubrobacteraceae bacterium]
MPPAAADPGAAARARAWLHARHAAVCDVLEPWAFGTVARTTWAPEYWDVNVVRVERDPGDDVASLIAAADAALAGLAHRRLDVEDPAAAERLRPAFAARGWRTTRLVLMRHEAAPPPGEAAAVEEVPYDAVEALRLAWHAEDFPGLDAGYLRHAREIALRRGARVLAARAPGGGIAAFADLETGDRGAEITSVYVLPEHRGAGLGTAVTRAAIGAADGAGDLWIAADDEDRPKDLYARLGFRPAFLLTELTRLP